MGVRTGRAAQGMTPEASAVPDGRDTICTPIHTGRQSRVTDGV